MEITKAKVFIIDDEINLLELTAEGLAFEGFEISTATGGIEGLQLIRETMPDIVICDINMPDMSGYEVLEALRNDSLTANIPFIFLSALTEHAEIREGMERGADDYLTKPVDMGELVQAIHSRLKRQANLQMLQMREFAHRLVMAQENERRNFSMILKDNLAASLSDLKVSLDTLVRISGSSHSQALQTASRLAGDSLNTINQLTYALWPSVLTQLGLVAALMSLFDQVQANSDFRIHFEHNQLELVHEPNLTIMVYRIVQEALNNTKQHAWVNAVEVKLWVEGEFLRLQIEDAGMGFDVQSALGIVDKVGLRSMVERAYLLNGELTIISAPHEGTHIFGTFPLDSSRTKAVLLNRKAYDFASAESSNPQKPEADLAVRVAIADSNELSRWGYRAIIENDGRFKIISELNNWRNLRRFLEDVELDILVISHALDGEERGLLSLQELHEMYPKLKILLLSHYTEYAFAAQALKNGVSAYLLKTSSSEDVRAALDALLAERQFLSREIVQPKQQAQNANNSQMDAFSTLTEREKEVFYRVVNGMTNLEIANELVISSRTVETHRLNMMRKLGLNGTAALINFAMNKGLVGRKA